MGKLNAGILGQLSGKVAGVVGTKWKNKAVLREYVIPANPNTTAQQTQRTALSDTVAFCKALVGQVFNKYVDKFQKGMSGFNYFIKQNIAIFDGAPDYSLIKLTFGKLWGIAITAHTSAAYAFGFTWVGTSLGNNGAATDKVYAAVYSPTTGLWYFATAEVNRSANTILVPVGAAENGNVCWGYIWAAKYSATSPTLLEMVSDSSAIDHAISA